MQKGVYVKWLKKKQSKGYKTRLNQWHPAFYAGIQIELEKENDKLTFSGVKKIISG